MFRIKKVISYLFGRELISSMRIKKKKRVDTYDGLMLSSDIAFAESARALAKAQEIAEYNKDIDAIVAISDRWAVLARTLELGDAGDNVVPFGFSSMVKGEEEHDHS